MDQAKTYQKGKKISRALSMNNAGLRTPDVEKKRRAIKTIKEVKKRK
jgi:hypothetical protein